MCFKNIFIKKMEKIKHNFSKLSKYPVILDFSKLYDKLHSNKRNSLFRISESKINFKQLHISEEKAKVPIIKLKKYIKKIIKNMKHHKNDNFEKTIQSKGAVFLDNYSFLEVFSTIGNVDTFLYIFELIFTNEELNSEYSNEIACQTLYIICFLNDDRKNNDINEFFQKNGFKIFSFLLKNVQKLKIYKIIKFTLIDYNFKQTFNNQKKFTKIVNIK